MKGVSDETKNAAIMEMALDMRSMSVDQIASRLITMLIADDGNLNEFQGVLACGLEAYRLSRLELLQ